MKTAMSHATIVEPTGVEYRIDKIIPNNAHTTEMIAEHITTPLKFCIRLIADNAGKMISAYLTNGNLK